ncbi:hypothetical protein B0H34DRAFT_801714 [Crassisporium funariophilum]|nr:hypothetical protein B0H34DRAFT_801714 [Crassisporium funariophilum]
MNSNAILRRVLATRSAARHRLLASTNTARQYATPSTPESDPQLNGYPQLPFVSRQTLPPLGWQDPLTRRNFGDTLHEQEEVLSMWGPDPAPIPVNVALRQFMVATIGFVAFGFLVKEIITQDPPAIRREYPYDGLAKELGGLEENKARAESVDTDS